MLPAQSLCSLPYVDPYWLPPAALPAALPTALPAPLALELRRPPPLPVALPAFTLPARALPATLPAPLTLELRRPPPPPVALLATAAPEAEALVLARRSALGASCAERPSGWLWLMARRWLRSISRSPWAHSPRCCARTSEAEVPGGKARGSPGAPSRGTNSVDAVNRWSEW